MNPADISELNDLSRMVCQDIIAMTASAGTGHYLSSLSCAEILVTLFFREMHIDASRPDWEDRDRFILSKGHAAPALYAVMARKGYFPPEELRSLRKLGTRLQGHPVSHLLPGLDASSGSLGQGLSTAIGIALSARLDRQDFRVFCLMGDGELQEGQVWEAMMTAAHFRVGNLVAIIDHNELQATGRVNEIMSLGDLRGKLESFGWKVYSTDGHDIGAMAAVFQQIRRDREGPVALVAGTVKGHGVPFLENNLTYHSAPLSTEQFRKAMDYLGGTGPA